MASIADFVRNAGDFQVDVFEQPRRHCNAALHEKPVDRSARELLELFLERCPVAAYGPRKFGERPLLPAVGHEELLCALGAGLLGDEAVRVRESGDEAVRVRESGAKIVEELPFEIMFGRRERHEKAVEARRFRRGTPVVIGERPPLHGRSGAPLRPQ